MEDGANSPMAVKVEKHQQCVIFTYFHGDTNSMVDAHFARALSTVCRGKAPTPRAKKMRKMVKIEKNSSCQGSIANAYSPLKAPAEGSLLSLSPVGNTPDTWHSFTTRDSDGPGLPSISYSLSTEGLSLTGQEYATSLLNLLHTDQAEGGPSGGPSTSKPEVHHGWMVQQGFRESVDPAFESGRRLDKKDLYWY